MQGRLLQFTFTGRLIFVDDGTGRPHDEFKKDDVDRGENGFRQKWQEDIKDHQEDDRNVDGNNVTYGFFQVGMNAPAQVDRIDHISQIVIGKD